ncbi:GNAT family N-acetyltransferase [Bradyrhizobium arachidis]|uniref:GNAT family N-acetyltransferase n=1 Tax=Bradyrhizobium arachidis TaxID=858423 RepID=A0AAE7NQZ7_9BRAD|nr:GNAT family N-acetyltransferase [Bradyrhizobium arachidis]QOZ68791.1 GNAT family N-acetyltransferase [Bradyrhizobium arachidis]SFV18716.1 Acetyltransferase (GNAT) family protein [Bradyrhizobium arachidis]
MVLEDTARTRSVPGYVRTLSQQEELPLLRDHLLRLDAASRHDRFNGFLDDSFIERYAARCAEDGTAIVAYIVDGVVRGAAELHPPEGDSLPEVAFSVEASVRRQNVGTILFSRLIAEARWKGFKRLRITTGAENHAMRALARKFGAHLQFRHGESTGTIDLTKTTEDELADLAAAPFKAGRALLSFNSTCWKIISSMYGSRAA